MLRMEVLLSLRFPNSPPVPSILIDQSARRAETELLRLRRLKRLLGLLRDAGGILLLQML
jgi:hypothetical protein